MSFDMSTDERIAFNRESSRAAREAGYVPPLTYVVREAGAEKLAYHGQKFQEATFWTETLRDRGTLDCCEVDGVRLKPEALAALEALTEIPLPFAGWKEGCSTLPPLRGNREPTWEEVLAAQSK